MKNLLMEVTILWKFITDSSLILKSRERLCRILERFRTVFVLDVIAAILSTVWLFTKLPKKKTKYPPNFIINPKIIRHNAKDKIDEIVKN